uniref:Uncharacterized protein n=1 Tax=Faecalibaculum rodentium TaxID=1702221 RepID=A0A140DTZ1_9FIRM|nr:hypothetical protein AALO17_09840 [Faecalibaculum rodentium]
MIRHLLFCRRKAGLVQGFKDVHDFIVSDARNPVSTGLEPDMGCARSLPSSAGQEKRLPQWEPYMDDISQSAA